MLYDMNKRSVVGMQVFKPTLLEDLRASGALMVRETGTIEGKTYFNAVACLVIPMEFYALSREEVLQKIQERTLELIGDSQVMFALGPL